MTPEHCRLDGDAKNQPSPTLDGDGLPYMKKRLILLIDDHALFRCGLRMVLQTGRPHEDICEADSLEEALQLSTDNPSLILLDVQLRGVNGIDGMSLLKRKWGDVPVIILSADASDATRREALARGALAFASKADTAEHILTIIAQVLDMPSLAPPLAPSSEKSALTPRQFEVLDLLSQGLTNKAIGRRLDLSENTIRVHVQAILIALEVDNRSEAAFAARRRGLIR
jgi:DNA-binding NarL/FixJ family response regulator